MFFCDCRETGGDESKYSERQQMLRANEGIYFWRLRQSLHYSTKASYLFLFHSLSLWDSGYHRSINSLDWYSSRSESDCAPINIPGSVPPYCIIFPCRWIWGPQLLRCCCRHLHLKSSSFSSDTPRSSFSSLVFLKRKFLSDPQFPYSSSFPIIIFNIVNFHRRKIQGSQ